MGGSLDLLRGVLNVEGVTGYDSTASHNITALAPQIHKHDASLIIVAC
jgi:hypothetical protein